MNSEYTQRKRVGGGYKTFPKKKPLPPVGNKKTTDKNLENEKLKTKYKDSSAPVRRRNDLQETDNFDMSQNEAEEIHDDANTGSQNDPEIESGNQHQDNDDDEIYVKQLNSEDSGVSVSNSVDNDIPAIQLSRSVENGIPAIQVARSVDSNIQADAEEKDESQLNVHRDQEETSQQRFHSTYEDYPVLQCIQENVIGNKATIEGPYGRKTAIYCDYTASGRSLGFIEDYIRDNVCPYYANTHSETGNHARQTSHYRAEARKIIKKCVHAGNDDVVVFTGSGVTSCIHKIIWGLRLREKGMAEDTVVFIGPYEHHSNILPWREMKLKLERIKEGKDGYVDLKHLEQRLKWWKDKRRNLLVAMSAASNVTGIIMDISPVSEMTHRYGGLLILDYAAGGPYLEVDMNRSKQRRIDAALFSPHKFVGGPGTPGVIIAKRWMFRNSVPDRVGGGTVTYVTRNIHGYISNIEEREEGGTPAIIESIRAGLVFRLKHSIGEDIIMEREEYLCRKAFAIWGKNPNLVVLGGASAKRVAIFSFIVCHRETNRYVHHNFIATLLNDLYGIQARGGCACAAPYGLDLIRLSEATVKPLLRFFVDKPRNDKQYHDPFLSILKPGFCRINLPYFYSDELCDFIIQAVNDVATYGWKLMPEYTFDAVSGVWHHKQYSPKTLNSLYDLRMDREKASAFGTYGKHLETETSYNLQECLSEARNLYTKADTTQHRPSTASEDLAKKVPGKWRHFKWFLTPKEVIDIRTVKKKAKPLFTPRDILPQE